MKLIKPYFKPYVYKQKKLKPYEKEERREKWKRTARVDRYHERESQMGPDAKVNWICTQCRKQATLPFDVEWPAKKCYHCGEEAMEMIGTKLRPPRLNASKRKWKEFWTNLRFFLKTTPKDNT